MTTNTPSHVILGTGPMGTAIARELSRRGNRSIRMINRSGNVPLDLAGDCVEVVKGDMYNVDSVRALTRGAQIVYQCAQPAYTEWLTKFPALQTAIIDGVAYNNAKLIVTENLYMYGDVDVPIHEGLPYAAHTKKGRVRAQMSQALIDAHNAGKLRVAIARGSDFFGPNDSVSGQQQYYPVLAGKTVNAIGNLDALHTYTFTEDFAKTLVILGERDEALGQAWHSPNASTITTREYLALIFKAAGKPYKVNAANKMMLRALGLFIPIVREIVEMYYEFAKPFVVDHAKFVSMFGNHATSLEEAVARTVAWFRQYPQLAH
jgi:nucleoside-diphosphate-sugar epimerase